MVVTNVKCGRYVVQVSQGLVGRMMADPAFLHKMAMEQAITISSSLWWEYQQRGDRFSKARLLAFNIAAMAFSPGRLLTAWLGC